MKTNIETSAAYHFETRETAIAFQRQAPNTHLFSRDTTLTPPDFAEMSVDRSVNWDGIDWAVTADAEPPGYEPR